MLGRLLVHIGVAGFDQILGGAVHEVEVVAGLVGRGIGGAVPFKAEPFHRVDDAVDVLGVFFFGVGVVKAQVAHAAIVARQAKVQADAFGVANVQVAIGFGRKAGADFGRVGLAGGMVRRIARAATPAAAGIGAIGQVRFDDLAQKIAGFNNFGGHCAGNWLILCVFGVTHAPDFRRGQGLQTAFALQVRFQAELQLLTNATTFERKTSSLVPYSFI